MQGYHHARMHHPQSARGLTERAVADLFARYAADAPASPASTPA